jgi:hypothetical protein
MQYTHGHSALVKDIMANQAAEQLPTAKERLEALSKASTGRQAGSTGMAVFSALAMPVISAGVIAVAGVVSGGTAAGVAAGGMALLSDGIWNGWKKIRDNVLDQHGCYIQYLNKNGQPMDAGLSYNQGMVVGKYASTKLLPTLMGTRTNIRTKDGYTHIRSDDLFKSIGWKEKEIANLVRHISLENAIVNAEMLKYSGIGPEKTGLTQSFRVVGMVTRVIDGDTLDIVDVVGDKDITAKSFRVRFDGLDTGELAETGFNGVLNGTGDEIVDFGNSSTFYFYGATPNSNAVTYNPSTSGGKALRFTAEAVVGKLVVLRINPDLTGKNVILTEDDLEAGGSQNVKDNYAKSIKKQGWTGEDRYMATIFYKTDDSEYSKIVDQVRAVFKKHINIGNGFEEKVTKEIFGSIYQDSIFSRYFPDIYNSLKNIAGTKEKPGTLNRVFKSTGDSDPLKSISQDWDKETIFSILVSLLVTLKVYQKASEWPMNGWDEYYDDGSPLTLNWELIINGLAKVYNKGLLLNTSPSQIPVETQIPMPVKVI